MTWDFPYVKPQSHLPPIPPRNLLVTMDPITWRNKYWHDRTGMYTVNRNYYKPGWYNAGYWLCQDRSCALCYPGNRDPKKYLTEYWQGFLKGSAEGDYTTWWSQHWPYFYGYGNYANNYWYYPTYYPNTV